MKVVKGLTGRLLASHVAVAVIALATTAGLVWALTPRFYSRMMQPGSRMGPGLGRGGGGFCLQLQESVREALWWGFGVGVLAAVILGGVAAWSLARSVRHIRAATAELARGNYATPVPTSTVVELGELSTDIQAMANSLADTEATRRRLIGEISHEMRTPLTVIANQTEALVDGILPADPDNLAVISAQVQRLGRLADDFSALSRAEEGRVELTIEPVDLSAIAADVVARLHPQADDKSVELDVQSHGPMWVSGDADRLSQIVTNLVGNALRATPPGGTITVSVSEGEHDSVALSVTDTGIGLEGVDLERVFERFYRVDPSQPGTGIGLTIARHLAELHGGSLTATSAGTGKGAQFTLTLPRLSRG